MYILWKEPQKDSMLGSNGRYCMNPNQVDSNSEWQAEDIFPSIGSNSSIEQNHKTKVLIMIFYNTWRIIKSNQKCKCVLTRHKEVTFPIENVNVSNTVHKCYFNLGLACHQCILAYPRTRNMRDGNFSSSIFCLNFFF